MPATNPQISSRTLPAPALLADIDRVISEANSLFNPLHNNCIVDYHVSGAKDGYVYLSLALPEGMTRVFVSLLESLTGFFRCINIKARSESARTRCLDPDDSLRRQGQQEEFRQEVCSVFDDLISQGISVKDAVKRTNSALKAQGSPWATYDVVQTVLRASGRFRSKKRG